jgi:hypothetical protein
VAAAVRGRARLEAALQDASPASQGWAAAQIPLGRTLSLLGDRVGAMAALNAVCEPGNGTDRSRWAADALLTRALRKQGEGDFIGASGDVGRALALACDVGCPEWEAPALAVLSTNAFYEGDGSLALDRVRQAEERLSGSVSWHLARWCMMQFTIVLTDAGELTGPPGRAPPESRWREVGDLRSLANMLVTKVRLELLTGNLAVATADLRQAARPDGADRRSP